MLPPKLVHSPRDQAIAQIRRFMGHPVHDLETRREASRETFSSPGDEMRIADEATKIVGSESVFRRIAKAKNVGDLLDCTVEIRLALMFDALRFEVRFLPPGAVELPDLIVSRDRESVYVEIKRIRPPHPARRPGALKQHEMDSELRAGLLQPYGGEEDLKKIEDDLRGKLRRWPAVVLRSTEGPDRALPQVDC